MEEFQVIYKEHLDGERLSRPPAAVTSHPASNVAAESFLRGVENGRTPGLGSRAAERRLQRFKFASRLSEDLR